MFTSDLTEFPAAAESWLRGDPVLNTVPLTVLARLRQGLWSDDAMLAWLTDGDAVRGVAVQTPPHPVVLAEIPPDSVRPLAEALGARALPGVSGSLAQADAFTAAWAKPESGRMAQRLYRLGTLEAAGAEGTARVADEDDHELLVEWYRAFLDEAEPPARDADPGPQVKVRVEHGELVLWEAGGRPVAMAAFSTPLARMSRVGPVYTPPESRRHGYGSAVTHAATAAARQAGASEVLLFTDLANPTSNSIYQALGYRPVTDYVTIWFGL
jgi:GNAT superfamily N-acetyltransferase